VWANEQLEFGPIETATQSAFGQPITGGGAMSGYRIFQYWRDWPDLRYSDWEALYPICSDNGKQESKAIADQILKIMKLLEIEPQCSKLLQTVSHSASVETLSPATASAESGSRPNAGSASELGGPSDQEIVADELHVGTDAPEGLECGVSGAAPIEADGGCGGRQGLGVGRRAERRGHRPEDKLVQVNFQVVQVNIAGSPGAVRGKPPGPSA
jgi:hypothetical protein